MLLTAATISIDKVAAIIGDGERELRLEPGIRLGPFEIIGLLGSGGMGEVYRAEDSLLKRDVAIKILPEDFVADPERVKRFKREAKMLAALNDPNIGALYDFRKENGFLFIVMEFVEGETLHDYILRGRAPLQETLSLFVQIARAMDAAHQKGIVHLDLKPGNIMITPEGRVKVLDFGLAKPILQSRPILSSDTTQANVLKDITTGGFLLGTPKYMSPEQARQKAVDKRSDIWAFGCILFEALTATPPFKGDTPVDVLATVIEREPMWGAVPGDLPPTLQNLLRRCLEKEPRRRLSSAGDIAIWLDELLDAWKRDARKMTPLTSKPLRGLSRRNLSIASLGAGIVLGVVISAFVILVGRDTSRINPSGATVVSTGVAMSELEGIKQFPIDIGDAQQIFSDSPVRAEVTVSPDGSRLVYSAMFDGTRRLFQRRMNELQAFPIAGTEGARHPFFSPDGNWIGFVVIEDRIALLKKLLIEGGAATTIAEYRSPGGAVWLSDETIVYSGRNISSSTEQGSFPSHLYRVHANGGTPEQLTYSHGPDGAEWGHYQPTLVPGEEAILFRVVKDDQSRNVALLRLADGSHTVIIENAREANYAPSGHIVFGRNDALWAVPFDAAGLEIAGKEAMVLPGVQLNTIGATFSYAIFNDGALVYAPVASTSIERRALVWVSHDRREETLAVEPLAFRKPRVSRDGTRIVAQIDDPLNHDIWIHTPSVANSLMRFTFDPAEDGDPVWAPDGSTVIFGSSRAGSYNVFKKRSDGVGAAEQVTHGATTQAPAIVSPDGTNVINHVYSPGMDWDLGAVSLVNDPNERIVVQTSGSEGNPSFSPDGNWIVYSVGTPGNSAGDLWVRPYPNLDDGIWQLSGESGNEPVWSADGTEIYYRAGGKMMAVAVETAPTFRAGTPRMLFEDVYYKSYDASTQYDLEYPEGKRFLMMKEVSDRRDAELVYVDNWSEQLKDLAPRHDVP